MSCSLWRAWRQLLSAWPVIYRGLYAVGGRTPSPWL